MTTGRTEQSKRRSAEDVEADVLATAHGLALALHRVGPMDGSDSRTIERLCLPAKPDHDGER